MKAYAILHINVRGFDFDLLVYYNCNYNHILKNNKNKESRKKDG